jgi:epoxyqueuosine reductase
MNPAERTRWICERARDVGFDLCGIAPVDEQKNAEAGVQKNDAAEKQTSDTTQAFRELEHLPEWLARGYAGGMKYLSDPRRADPRLALEGVRSLIVVALNYNAPEPRSTDQGKRARATGTVRTQHAGSAGAAGDTTNGTERLGSAERYLSDDAPRGWISRYAWGDDYHEVLREKLKALVAAMRAEYPEPFEARAYVDTGPVIERVAAKYAGLGWLAKNTFLINQQLGSWLFLGVILTTMELAPSLAPGQAPALDLCGSCTRCLDACPTQAFPQPYVLDARRCISYLTIELRGSIPEDLREGMGSAAIGCDICQDVCPWNRKAPVMQLAAFQPRKFSVAEADGKGPPKREESLFAPKLEWLASLTQQEFSAAFRGSAVKRAKWRGLVRNACVALGNAKLAPDSSAHARVSRLLERLASGEDEMIAEHARWALAQIAGRERSSTLQENRENE